MIGKEKNILPDFPRTRHLPHKPNTAHDDTIASEAESHCIFTCDETYIEEKIDGANTGICLYEGNPIIRNRNHILSKAFIQRRTAAKMQFASIFNWFYENMEKFDKVNEALGFEAAIYGEWMYAAHGLNYDALPGLWVPYDIYDWHADKFLATPIARRALECAGFTPVPLLYNGKVESWEQLERLCQQDSLFAVNQKREGIYVKVTDAKHVVERFKMVREGFKQGGLWKDDSITRNKVKVKK